jgi:hypothetical protein
MVTSVPTEKKTRKQIGVLVILDFVSLRGNLVGSRRRRDGTSPHLLRCHTLLFHGLLLRGYARHILHHRLLHGRASHRLLQRRPLHLWHRRASLIHRVHRLGGILRVRELLRQRDKVGVLGWLSWCEEIDSFNVTGPNAVAARTCDEGEYEEYDNVGKDWWMRTVSTID